MIVKTIDEIIDDVLVKNNSGYLREEQVRHSISEGRMSITRSDVKDIIKNLPIIIYGSNTSVDITPNGIVVKPTTLTN